MNFICQMSIMNEYIQVSQSSDVAFVLIFYLTSDSEQDQLLHKCNS